MLYAGTNTSKNLNNEITRERLHGYDIILCRLSAEMYATIYYQQMKKVEWRPIADAMAAHWTLAEANIFALKHNDNIIATLSAAKSSAFGVAYMGFFIVDSRFTHSNTNNQINKRTWIYKRVFI